MVREARNRGWDVRSLSRRLPAPEAAYDDVEYLRGDVAEGIGLAAALDGVDVVVDALEGQHGRALRTYPLAGRRLLDAAKGSSVVHAVSLSIAACDQISLRLYRSKVAKERVYADHPLPTTVVRCAQFHDLLDRVFASGARFAVIPVLRGARLQPMDVRDVARALVDSAEAAPGASHLWTASGPEVQSMRALAEQWRRAAGVGRRVVEFPVPGRDGRALAEGRNVVPETAFGTVAFGDWLDEKYGPPVPA